MPQKTIYVKEDNMVLYDRAEQLSGEPLAQLIPKLLRDYIDAKDANIFAVTYIDYTADDVPHFEPEYFVVAPAGTTLAAIRTAVATVLPTNLPDEAKYVIPMLYADADIKQTYASGTLPVVDFPVPTEEPPAEEPPVENPPADTPPIVEEPTP